MIGLRTSPRPAPINYESLADLYKKYDEMFLEPGAFERTITSECGLDIHLIDRHFLHLIGLQTPQKRIGTLNIQEEKSRILDCCDGFGDYLHDKGRARQLPATLDCLQSPDMVLVIDKPQTATLSFFKHYGDPPYAVLQVLVGPSESGRLIPVTAFPTKLRQARTRVSNWQAHWIHPEIIAAKVP